MTRRLVAALAVAAIVVLPTAASAHPLGQRPVAYIERDSIGISFDWVVAPDEVRVLANHLRLGPIRQESLAVSDAFVAYMRARVKIETADTTCEMASRVFGAQASTGWSLRTRFECGSSPEGALVTVTLLHDVSKDYVTLWQAATAGGRARGSFTAARPSQQIVFAGVAPVLPKPSVSARPQGFTARAIDSVQSGRGIPFALILAFLLGAAHALAPGHGKTIAAAVMVSNGSRRRALKLAAAVSGTHLMSVGVLSAIVVAGGAYSLPRGAAPVMQAAAGVLAISIAYRIWSRTGAAPTSDHDHDRPDRSMLAGVVGGLVPSPAAVTLALVAFAAGRWIAGVLVIALFSLGLGAVVFGVSLIAARGGRLLGADGPRTTLLARLAAAAIGISGLALLVSAILPQTRP